MVTAPTKVVYLWGAGATHGEAQRLGSPISLLMRDTDAFGDGIASRILKRVGTRVASAYGIKEGVDIEKLISLLAASGNDDHTLLAEKLRQAYFTELKVSLNQSKLLHDPYLATKLFELHADPAFSERVEKLSGFITTNHDGLLQIASQKVLKGVNIGFEFESDDFEQRLPLTPPILQLHGSFTWQFGQPTRISKLSLNSPYKHTVWIPPTILKESKNFPFNKLSGLAYELLARQCDILRIVGTSLTQNDWNILSLIFNAQRHREAAKGKAFRIELVMPHKQGEHLRRECTYLRNLTSIGFLTDGKFAAYKNDSDPIPPESDLANPFRYWLEEKITFHQSRGECSAGGGGGGTTNIAAAAS